MMQVTYADLRAGQTSRRPGYLDGVDLFTLRWNFKLSREARFIARQLIDICHMSYVVSQGGGDLEEGRHRVLGGINCDLY